jgi:hypothetical protein
MSDRLSRFFKILDCFGQALAMTRGRFLHCVPQAIVFFLVNFLGGALCLSGFVAGNCLNRIYRIKMIGKIFSFPSLRAAGEVSG